MIFGDTCSQLLIVDTAKDMGSGQECGNNIEAMAKYCTLVVTTLSCSI